MMINYMILIISFGFIDGSLYNTCQQQNHAYEGYGVIFLPKPIVTNEVRC